LFLQSQQFSSDFPNEKRVVCICMQHVANPPASKRPGPLERFSVWIGRATGSTPAFIGAAGMILLWLVAGPLFSFSSEWQLVVNTGTTIITFLMVFVIQRAQNKESVAIQLKLNELVAAYELASNRLVSVEDLTEEELQVLQAYYRRLAEMAKHSQNLQESHSIEEADNWHHKKHEHHRSRRAKQKNNDSHPDSNRDGHTISSSQ
jgi:low affinity Fe/Cu permease